MNKYLLLISCSGNKDKSGNKLPAIDRYTGVYYKIIKKLKREGKLSRNLDIIIISAKYGFLKPDDLINYYDQKMDKNRAKILNKEIVSNFKGYLKDKRYNEIFINLSKDYMLAINGFQEFIPSGTKIIIAKGGIGKKMKQTKEWLLSLNKDSQ